MRARSRKREAEYRQRRKLVARLLEERPTCQRCGSARSTEIHEVLSRARGGSILREDNCKAICRSCHEWITTHPLKATAQGWLRSQYEGGRSA